MTSPKHFSTYKIAQTSALSKYLEVATESILLSKLFGRIDSTASTDDYYIQLISAASLPSDGSITLLITPLKISHANGQDSFFDIDFSTDYIKSKNGLYIVASTTEFTKTIVSTEWMSCTAFYH